MQNENNTISQNPKKKALITGVLTVVAVLSVGFSIGIVTGVIDVPFTEACCVLPPPVIVPPPIVVIPPTTILIPSCELDVTATTNTSATLSWAVVNTVNATIDNGVGSVAIPSGSVTVNPSATTNYTMTVQGPGGQATCGATVTVAPPPTPAPTCTLTANPTSVLSGTGTTLSWTTTNATNFTIDNGVGSVTPVSGGSTAAPAITSNTTYTGTATGAGGTVTCSAPVTVTTTPPPPPPAPTCTLAASPTSFVGGGSPTLSWTTTNATTFTIDNGVGAVTPVAGGSAVAPAISANTTYTGTATGAGGTVTCGAAVTVTPVPPGVPFCTLTATPGSFVGSGAPTLSWTTQNATSFSIDNAIGSVTPVAAGSQLAPTITTTTTYTGTATGPGGTSAPCTAVVTVTTPPPPNAPSCTLTAAPTSFVGSGAPVLSWTTTNATAFSIDNAIGSVTPVAAGSTTAPTISVTTTYTGTATGPGGTSAPCAATVTITTTPVLACTLTANPNALGVGGGTTELDWTTQNAVSFSIDNGVGAEASIASGTTTSPNITSDTTFTGTATDASGATITCTAPVTVQTPGGGGGGCTSGCGGGGGGGGHPTVFLDVLHNPQPLAFVYLSQIPYTGLDLGPIGTVVYWIVLVVWSLALAYLVLFIALPWLGRRMQAFGADVKTALNNAPQLAAEPVAVYAAPVGAPQVRKSEAAAAPVRGYSSYDGFRSFAAGDALSIDDIVNGLAREHVAVAQPAEEAVMFSERSVAPQVEPIYENVETIRAAAPVARQAAPAVHPDVPAFLTALINSEREAVFGMFRDIVRAGADAEAFLTQVACALDDAYRARLEGAPVHAEVKRITDPVATSVLEKLVTSLASAVDSSYSVGITGAKLALTRALAVTGA